jgi:SAM-dependent methyltransferase
VGIRRCPACLGEATRQHGSAHGFKLVRCAGCDTVFTTVLPATESDSQDYSTYYHEGNLTTPAFVEQRLDELVAGFEPYRSHGTWLDVGCGIGTLVRVAQKRGWTTTGTEVASGVGDVVGDLDVRFGELEELDLGPASFDVVSAIEVLEHVPDPGALVAAAASLIRPGGVFYATTPHGRGISARLLGNRWSVFSPPEHLQLFSTAGLRSLLGRADLSVSRLRANSVNPRELLTMLRSDHRYDRNQSSQQLNESLSAKPSGRLVKTLANGVLSTLRLGDNLKVTAERSA